MMTNNFQGKQLSRLGFGTMRLPTMADGSIDEVQVAEMTAYALDYLADKYPGHQISSTGYDPAGIFEEQLKKCGVEYFDFYLLHNVYEKSMEVYLDSQWGIVDYFKEQKRLGPVDICLPPVSTSATR